MKRFVILLALLILVTSELFAQDNKCDCLENLNKLIAKTEENYAGFPTKVNEDTRDDYNKLIRTLEKRTAKETNPKACFYILKEYVLFFKDKHFYLGYSNSDDFDNEIINLSEDTFKSELLKKEISKVEGIWLNQDTTLTLAVKRFPNGIYKAIVLTSKDPKIPSGLVYLTLTPTKSGFIAKEYNSFGTIDIPANLKGNLLQIWNHLLLGKTFPNQFTEEEKRELSTWRNDNNGLDFQVLSPKTTYLKVPTFLNNDDKIQQLISKNDATIKASDNLIIDLSGNGGGNTGWISFLPYLITSPISQYGYYLRVTPENVKSELVEIGSIVNEPIGDEWKSYFTDEVIAEYKKVYKELPITKEPFYLIPAPDLPFDSNLLKPKKIAVIVDDRSGSSSEFFFFLTKQSKKVTTYGTNTIGMMDYIGMSNPTPLPYEHYFLTIPKAKASWTDTNPIDQTGFKPDKLLNHIKQVDWVEYIRKDLEK